MTAFSTRLTTALRNRRAYARTRRELGRLSIDTQLDLDIHAGDADSIARRAVYGL